MVDSNQPKGPKKREKEVIFGEIRNSLKPFKGFLQSIDEFFQLPFSSFPIYLKEKDDEHLVVAELPGVKKEQIHIDILNNSLTISVKHHEILTEENEEKQYYKKSQSLQQMSRNIYLGYPIDEKRVRATYQNGLLKIRVPKAKGKKIDILEES